MAWHSGRNNTTNTFMSCPWYMTQLGLLAPTHSVQCRQVSGLRIVSVTSLLMPPLFAFQTLQGGWYELVDKWTQTPVCAPDFVVLLTLLCANSLFSLPTDQNPDFWVAHLWKRTMGTGVLQGKLDNSTGSTGDLFLFPHCAAGTPGVSNSVIVPPLVCVFSVHRVCRRA